MKKAILFVLCLFMASALHSQVMVKFGVKTGANLSMLYTNDGGIGISFKFKPAVYGGAFMQVGKQNVFFQPEVVYSRQGGLYKGNSDRISYAIDYINIPLMLRVGGRVATFDVGPQLGFMIGSRQSYKNRTGKGTTSYKDAISNFDIAVSIGGSVRVYKGLEFNARFNLGLNTAMKAHTYVTSLIVEGDPLTARYTKDILGNRNNLTLQLGFSYTFNSGK